MSNQFRKYSVAVAAVALACFGAGYFSTGGAYSLERHRAVNQANSAAREVDGKRQDLEESLVRAQSVADDAASVADDARVKNAAQSLTLASEDALNVAIENDVDVMAEAVEITSTPTTTTTSAPDDDQDTPASEGDSTDVTASTLLGAKVDGIDSARDATTRLKEAGEALDDALAEVEARTASVKDATVDANLVKNIDEITTAIALVPAASREAAAALVTIGLQVEDSAVLAGVHNAKSALETAVTESEGVDRTDPDAVEASLATLTKSRTDLERAVAAASASYSSWIEAENVRITALNKHGADQYKDSVIEARAAYTEANLAFAASRSNGWAGEPTTISGSNGRLASGSLCDVSFAPGHHLQCDAADALAGADAAYFAQSGKHLVMTDSYRSFGLQVRTRANKGSMAAVAGTSNHGWGMAIDLDSASATWLTRNGPRFGWILPDWARPGGSKPESWHLEYVAPEVGGFTTPEGPTVLELVENELSNP